MCRHVERDGCGVGIGKPTRMHNERFWLAIPQSVDGATYRYSVYCLGLHDSS